MPSLYSETPLSPFSSQKGNFDGTGNQCNTLRSTNPSKSSSPTRKASGLGILKISSSRESGPNLTPPLGGVGGWNKGGRCGRLQSQNGHVFNVSLWNIHLVLKHKLWICHRFTLKHLSPLFLRKRATSMGRGTSATPLDRQIPVSPLAPRERLPGSGFWRSPHPERVAPTWLPPQQGLLGYH